MSANSIPVSMLLSYLKGEMLRKVCIYNFRYQLKKNEGLGHVACMETMRNAYRILVRKPGQKREIF
jgi:hypothetical protein